MLPTSEGGAGGESYSHRPPWARDAAPHSGCCLRRMRSRAEHVGYTAPSSWTPKLASWECQTVSG